MKEAAERLTEAESAATDHQRRAHKDAYESAIYPPGSEYLLVHAECQCMLAVIAVLNESLTESAKGFYRLRKAYATLQVIAAAEQKYLESKGISNQARVPHQLNPATLNDLVHKSATSGQSQTARNRNSISSEAQTLVADQDDDDDLDFVDADDTLEDAVTTTYQGHIETGNLTSKMSRLNTDGQPQPETIVNESNSAISDEAALSQIFTHPIDIFIHSGTNLCFGILQVMLSLVPPAFTKLLSIIGFRGDRRAGIQMLWRASAYENINGAMSGLVLLAFYHNMIAFCDIVMPDAYPKARCIALLDRMQQHYPKGKLWLLERSRVHAIEGQLEKAVGSLERGEPSELKQVEALRLFERSLNNMYLHRYEACAEGFLKVRSSSPALPS